MAGLPRRPGQALRDALKSSFFRSLRDPAILVVFNFHNHCGLKTIDLASRLGGKKNAGF
jgi:hypothetical protein